MDHFEAKKAIFTDSSKYLSTQELLELKSQQKKRRYIYYSSILGLGTAAYLKNKSFLASSILFGYTLGYLINSATTTYNYDKDLINRYKSSSNKIYQEMGKYNGKNGVSIIDYGTIYEGKRARDTYHETERNHYK